MNSKEEIRGYIKAFKKYAGYSLAHNEYEKELERLKILLKDKIKK